MAEPMQVEVVSADRVVWSGHATNIIVGVSVGLESTGMPIVIIAIALLSSFTLGRTSGLGTGVGRGDGPGAVRGGGSFCSAELFRGHDRDGVRDVPGRGS